MSWRVTCDGPALAWRRIHLFILHGYLEEGGRRRMSMLISYFCVCTSFCGVHVKMAVHGNENIYLYIYLYICNDNNNNIYVRLMAIYQLSSGIARMSRQRRR